MNFPYRPYDSNNLRPVITLRIIHEGVSFEYDVLVDSGADFCLFHAEIAEALNLNFAHGKKGRVTGVNGESIVLSTHPIIMDVGGFAHEAQVSFLPNAGDRTAPYGIVGQKGFFEFFKITFNRLKGELELIPIG